MRIPQFERYAAWFSGIGLFIAGMIIGSAVFMAIFQHNFSLLSIRNSELRTEAGDLARDLEMARKTNNKEYYIGRIKVQIEPEASGNAVDPITKDELVKLVHQDLSVLSGKPVSLLQTDPALFRGLINEKMTIQDKDYRVRATSFLLIKSDLTVWIQVSK